MSSSVKAKTGDDMARQSITQTCLAILAIIAVVSVLSHTKDLFAPIVSAMLLGIVMIPLSDLWMRLRVPTALAAFLSVLMALSFIALLFLFIEPYISEAVNQMPLIMNELQSTIDQFRNMLRGLEEMTEDVAEAIETTAPQDSGAVALPSPTDALVYAPYYLAQFMIFAGTLYFFLMVQNEIYAWVGKTFKSFGETELRHAGSQVARYVLTISAINLALGIVVAIVMHLIGMPSPIMWGFLAFALNFVLYLGPIVMITTLLITGIVVFDGPASFLPAALYLGMNAIEAQFVTPTLVGRSLSVNPLLVFLSLVFWLWLWGPVGGIIAIPLLIWGLAVFKGFADHTISSGTPGSIRAAAIAGSAE